MTHEEATKKAQSLTEKLSVNADNTTSLMEELNSKIANLDTDYKEYQKAKTEADKLLSSVCEAVFGLREIYKHLGLVLDSQSLGFEIPDHQKVWESSNYNC